MVVEQMGHCYTQAMPRGWATIGPAGAVFASLGWEVDNQKLHLWLHCHRCFPKGSTVPTEVVSRSVLVNGCWGGS